MIVLNIYRVYLRHFWWYGNYRYTNLVFRGQNINSKYTINYIIYQFNCNCIYFAAGAHRLWSHRSYKANYKLRLILTIANLIAFQNSIYDWVNDDDIKYNHNLQLNIQRFNFPCIKEKQI